VVLVHEAQARQQHFLKRVAADRLEQLMMHDPGPGMIPQADRVTFEHGNSLFHIQFQCVRISFRQITPVVL
jgi:hypothetical protein